MAGDLRGRQSSQEPEVSTKESSPGFSPFESGSSVTSIDGPNPAVLVGYACRVAGADRPSKLWDNIVEQKDVRCKMPADRFNVDNFFHPDGTHKGTTNAKYGYYLDQDLGRFDRSFFRISGKEAEAMDPQQRLILEVVYEALEDAGITLEEMNGSRTSVLCGSFTNDYNAMLTKDLEYYPSYTVTGTGNAILSNRVSYVFNLQGMSLTIDTACSSSLVAFHLGAQSIQSGDCDTSIIVGSALHFDPNIFITMTDLGMLSEEGRSRAFAAGVKGYARGDGVCAVILRGQRQAELHGDDIRAIVRATGSNHDGTKQGITLPSSDGQEELIRKTYRSAGLDPVDTTYVEAHGTGTGRGDPLETKALGAVFGSTRRTRPLYVGSIKSNIGHTEGASGLAGIIKATMALEKGQIPPNMHFKIPNPEIKFDDWQIEVPTELVDFPVNAHGRRRVSINSFGYGGANAHVVLEDYRPHTIQERPPSTLPPIFEAAVQHRPFLVPLTTHSDKAGNLLTERLIEYLDRPESRHVADLAVSLSTARSMHEQRSYAIGSNVPTIQDSLRKVPAWTKTSKQVPRLGFVFTGQGAQWYAMGRQLMEQSPIFLQTLQRADQVLKALPDGPQWSVVEELSRTKEASQLSQTHLSQPICTALQLAILELLKTWGVEPTAVVGHSSGEMGAAFAAGILSFESAMYAAYYRGLHMSNGAAKAGPDAIPGAMMAVGLGESEAAAELQPYHGRAVIAAVNSPSSVTLSGDEDAILEVQQSLEARKIFARRLQVAQAFHSHHMFPLAPAYAKALNECVGFSPQASDKARMFSSVTARVADAEQMGAAYWTANMTGTVRFSDALVGILIDDSENQNVDVLVEIGPHAALKGPARQVMKSLNMDLPYLASLTRGTPDYEGLLGLAGQLFQVGYPVDLVAVNSDAYLTDTGLACTAPRGRRLKDLPSYAWDHSERYWAETRLIHNHRRRAHRHSLLGAKMAGSIENHVRWRNYLRIRELPWLADHVIDGKVLFPAAGYMSLAFEAVARAREGLAATDGFALRNVSIKSALVLDDSDLGTELIVDIHPQVTSAKSRSDTWYAFEIFSYDSRYNCTEHCSGLVAVEERSGTTAAQDRDGRLQSSTAWSPVSRYYRHLSDIGLQYGDAFRLLKGSIESGPGFACASLTFSPEQYAAQPADVTLVHPTMLDATFHTIFPALEQVLGRDLDEAYIPTFVESCHIYPAMLALKDAQGPQEVWVDTTTHKSGFRSAISHLSVETAEGHQPLLSFSGLRVTSLGTGDDSHDRSLFFRTRWQAAFDQLRAETPLLSQASLAELLDIFVHQHPNTKILHLTAGVADTEQVLQSLSGPSRERRRLKSLTPMAGATVASGEAWEQLAGKWPGLVTLDEPVEQDYDLVLVTGTQQRSVLPFLKPGGPVIARAHSEPEPELETLFQTPDLSVWKAAPPTTTTTRADESNPKPLVMVHSSPPSSQTVDLISRLAATMKHRPTSCVGFGDLATTPLGDADVVVLASLDGPLFMQRDADGERSFDAARHLLLRPNLNLVWLLEGATDQVAENPLNALIIGLARVARMENEGSRIVTLDLPVDCTPQSAVPWVHQLLDREIADEEWSLRDGTLFIPRIEADDELNAQVRGGVNSGQKLGAFGSERPIKLTIGHVGRLESLVWEDDEEIRATDLAPDEIEIAVQASTVTARDVATATGTLDDFRLGDECAGRVLRVGAQVDPAQFQPGDKVLAIRPGQGAHRSVVRNPAACCFRLGPMPFEAAAALPQILVTPYYALVEIARLQAGESVLVHAAASGVGQMAVQIAQMVGAHILATAGSDAERELLVTRYGVSADHIFSSRDLSFVDGVQKATGGRGVDVVLNSLSGKLLHGSWSCVAAFGRFIEIGKQDINENAMLEMAPFQRNVLFASVDLVTLYATNQALGARLFQKVCDLCHVGKLGMPETVLGVPYSDAPKAFRIVQNEGHIGQVVLMATDKTQVPIRPPTWNRRANQFSADKTYLLAGGLGGLGRTLAEWMVQRNAKRLVFLSRSGETREEARSTVAWLRAHGIQVTVHKGDVANLADVEACVRAIPHLGGVFHAAMVLADAALENMTYAQWHQCVQPKVVGAYNLHQATQDRPLDFFVAFSSVSACFGTKSQGNYAAANTYLDALMRHRRQVGLPASTMNCGRITGIGVAAEAASLERFMEQEGFDGVNGQELLQQVEEAVFSDQTATVSPRGVDLYQTVTGVILTRDDVYWAAHSLFQNLYQNHDFDRRSGQKPGEVSLPVLFAQVPDPAQRAALLLERFVEKLAVSLGVPKESPKPADPIYGLDSLLAVDLRNWFTKTLGVDIALFDVMGAPSIRALIEKAVTLYKDQELKSGKPTPPKASSASAPTGSSSDSGAATIAIPKADLAQPLPLSTFQNRLWFSHSLAQDKSFLNIPVVMQLRGTPDHSLLRRTLHELQARNPILRTAYQEGDDFAEQTILEPTECRVKFRDVSAHADPSEALQTLVSTLKRTELDIEGGALIDATLVKVTPENYALVLIMHHICTDRGNTHPLLTQITTLYDTLRSGRSLSAIPAPKVTYADFTLWHNQLLSSDALVPHLDYWRQTLAGMPTASPLLPFAIAERPSWDDYARATLTAQLDATQLKRIKRICSQAQSSPFQFLFSAFRAFLYRYTADKDLTILMVDGNRPHAEFNDLLGFFVNMTPIRCQDACDGTFEDLLKTMSGRILESMSHSVVPFDVIVSETKVARSAGHFPLGQVLVNYQQPEGQAVYQAGDFALHKLEAENMPSGCELSLEAREDSDNVLQLQLEFSTTLYGEPDMRSFFGNFQTFLTSVIKDHRQPIATVPVAGPTEMARLGVQFWNHQSKPHSWNDTTMVQRVLGFAETQPDAIAIATSEGETITYRDLVFASRRLAFSLQDAGIRHGQYIGILADPGIPLVVSMLGALFHRCGYLPMDPTMAVGRLSFITDDSQMGLLLFDEASRVLAAQVRAQSKSPYGLLSIRDATASCVLADVRPSLRSDPCYMLYTSGSTGIPKGVRLSQSNVHEMLASMQQHFNFSPRDRFLHQISPSFDLSVVELWSALTAGARLCIATKATRRNPVLLGDYMRQESVTVSYFTPTQFALVLEHNGAALVACPEYRIALLCGERLPARLADAFQRLGTQATLYNCWGPTEAVVQTTIHAVEGPLDDQLNIPIGFALGNCRHYIVDDNMNPLPAGFIGELCIGGPQVARGYWNRPEVNRKQFVRNPFCYADDEDRGWTMLFRTGDRARFLPDGQLEFLGRISGDKQVKLRGFRIDLGEVEHVMHRESFTPDGQGIVDLAVVARPVEEDPASLTDDRQLVAFVVPKKPLKTAAEKKEYALLLQARAKFSLNDYMLPNAYQFLDALPTTTSGKTDRRGLLTFPVDLTHPTQAAVHPPTDQVASAQNESVAPKEARPDTLAAVSRAWQAVLKLEGPPEPTGNFFDMGGQSLLFLRLQGKLKKEFKVALSLQDMIQNPTPKHVAELVDQLIGGGRASSSSTPTTSTNNTDKKTTRSQTAETVDWVAETTLPMDCRFHPSESHPPAAVANILLTGADGFTGIHLLANLLTQRPGVTVYVLGTYAPLDHGQIFQKLMEFQLVNGSLTPERILTGIQVVPGFLANESHFGLPPADFKRLATSIHAVYHLVSEVSLLKTYRDLKHINTTSTLTLIELANLGGQGSRIHYLSTWSVPHLQSWAQSHRTLSGIQVKEMSPIHFSPPATVDNGYFKTRWATEMLLTRAAARGFPVTIYRSSAISGNTVTGVASSDQDIVRGMVMDMVRHGVVPQAGTASEPFVIDFIPVNYLADALGHLTLAQDTDRQSGLEVLHITNPQPLPLDQLPQLTSAVRGDNRVGRSVRVEEWLAALEQAVGEDEQLRLETLRDYFLNGHNMFALDCRKANALLAEVKDLVECPPVDEKYLHALWTGTA